MYHLGCADLGKRDEHLSTRAVLTVRFTTIDDVTLSVYARADSPISGLDISYVAISFYQGDKPADEHTEKMSLCLANQPAHLCRICMSRP